MVKYKYMYLDESGDLGFKRGSSDFLIISALVVEEPRELDRIIKRMRRNKFKKELRKSMEIKANKSSPEVKIHMLREINKVKGAKVFHVVLEKKKVFSHYLRKNKSKLYNFIAGRLAKNIFLEDTNLEIQIDKSKGSPFLQKDFNDYFENKLKENCDGLRCKISHSYSHSWSGLQFVDVIVWSCFQKFEFDNSEYLDELDIEQEVYMLWKKEI